jgi:hypothetical protein
MYADFLSKWVNPIEVSVAVTTAQVDEGAFALNSEGFTTEVSGEVDETKDTVVVRAYIPYTMVDKFDDYDIGIKYLAVIQNEMLKKMKSLKKDISKVSFRRAGMPQKMFIDCSDRPAVEIRCFLMGQR